MVFCLTQDDRRLTPMGANAVERLPILTRIRTIRVVLGDNNAFNFTVTGRDGQWHETNDNAFM